VKAVRGGPNTDAQIREMMDDFYDGIIDKLITLLNQEPTRARSPTIYRPWCGRWQR